jgi:hypothetical protein
MDSEEMLAKIVAPATVGVTEREKHLLLLINASAKIMMMGDEQLSEAIFMAACGLSDEAEMRGCMDRYHAMLDQVAEAEKGGR